MSVDKMNCQCYQLWIDRQTVNLEKLNLMKKYTKTMKLKSRKKDAFGVTDILTHSHTNTRTKTHTFKQVRRYLKEKKKGMKQAI